MKRGLIHLALSSRVLGAAALLFMRFEMWCFVLPPIVVGLSLAARIAEPAGQ